jgi:aldose 1-epimerase
MTLRLQSGAAVAEIAPDRGGGVAELRVGDRPVLCAGAGRPEGSPFALGLNLLLPFSNRISGPFPFEGQQHAIQPNLSGEPFPIHGDAFQRAWSVQAQAPGEVVLYLSEGRIGPYLYEAQVIYRLAETSFEVVLTVTSRAAIPLPFGLGFHPWFPRNAHTRLRFHADGHWPQDDRFLPTTVEPVPVPPEWRFDAPSPLPSGWINTAFSGWDSQIELDQDDAAVPLCIRAPGLTTLIVYSPGAEFPFVCLEPVSHPVDAHNLPGQPGLVPLSPGDSRSGTMTLTWDSPSGARLHAGCAEALSTPSAAS